MQTVGEDIDETMNKWTQRDWVSGLNSNHITFILTSLGPMVLGEGFSGATIEDMRPTGSLSVNIDCCKGFGVTLFEEKCRRTQRTSCKEPNRTELRVSRYRQQSETSLYFTTNKKKICKPGKKFSQKTFFFKWKKQNKNIYELTSAVYIENGLRRADGGLRGEEETGAHFFSHMLIAILIDITVDQPSTENLSFHHLMSQLNFKLGLCHTFFMDDSKVL